MKHEERRLAESAHGYIDDLRTLCSEYREALVLLDAYCTKKFSSEFWPQNDAEEYLGQERAERLTQLLEKL